MNALSWTAVQDQPGQDNVNLTVTVYPDLRYQMLQGVGGAFSELGGQALQALPDAERERAMAVLFHPTEGIGLSWGRLPMGASDFALDAYSCCDAPGDYGMERFSLERDERLLLPYVRAARRIRPDLRLHASPWSPPAWLKTTGNMVQGGHLIDTPEALDAYARYFVRFVQGYAERGVPIARIMPQNEPDVTSTYPSCVMPAELMARWLTRHLAPAWREAGLATELWAGCFRTVTGLPSHEALALPGFRDAIAGAGFQYSFPETLADVARAHPGLPLMHTESVCHNGKNTWEQAGMLFYDIIMYLRAGCDVYTYWNMVLDQGARSTWGWRQNSLLTVDTEARSFRTNPDAAVLRLFAHHLQPGAQRIEAFCFQRKVLAVRRADGRHVVLVAHPGPKACPLTVVCGGRTQVRELPPRSFNALVLEDAAFTPKETP